MEDVPDWPKLVERMLAEMLEDGTVEVFGSEEMVLDCEAGLAEELSRAFDEID